MLNTRIYSYHTVDHVTREGVASPVNGGHRTEGPPKEGDFVKSDDDGKFYQVVQIITLVKPVEGEVVEVGKPRSCGRTICPYGV